MARRRAPEPFLAEGVPAPLADHTDPLWHDAAATTALFDAYGLELRAGRTSIAAAPWHVRFGAFREGWCKVNGLTHPKWHPSIDYQRAREAGVDMHPTSRYRLRSK